jgi:hypothetical protein
LDTMSLLMKLLMRKIKLFQTLLTWRNHLVKILLKKIGPSSRLLYLMVIFCRYMLIMRSNFLFIH